MPRMTTTASKGAAKSPTPRTTGQVRSTRNRKPRERVTPETGHRPSWFSKSQAEREVDGKRLRELKEARLPDWTWSYLAQRLKQDTGMSITRQHVSSWIHGKRVIPRKAYPALCRLLGVHPTEFPIHTQREADHRLFKNEAVRLMLIRADRMLRTLGDVPVTDDMALYIRTGMKLSPDQFPAAVQLLSFLSGKDAQTIRAVTNAAKWIENKRTGVDGAAQPSVMTAVTETRKDIGQYAVA